MGMSDFRDGAVIPRWKATQTSIIRVGSSPPGWVGDLQGGGHTSGVGVTEF